nr:MAG TPA: hypothetical protein [Caudoviricetes sp.]
MAKSKSILARRKIRAWRSFVGKRYLYGFSRTIIIRSIINMAKQKIYDPSLISSVRQRSRDYSNYLSPKADLDSYVHTMSNIPT